MRPLRFRIVALIAAYALALHALIAVAAVAPSNAASHVAALCSGLAADPDRTLPPEHDASCAMACAMLGGDMAAPLPGVVATGAPSLVLVRHSSIDQIPPRPAVDGRPRARAPPPA